MADPTTDIEHEADEAMMRRKWWQDLINQNNVLEVVDHAFSIQEIHGSPQEIPVCRFCESQASGFAWNINDAHHFLERNDLNCRDEHYNIDVTCHDCANESSDHQKRPYRSCNECRLFLLVVWGNWRLNNKSTSCLVAGIAHSWNNWTYL